jgi:aryl-alcohol dehydrogenase-like predicted oxidoreductase
MRTTRLGELGEVSRLSLGGGIGQIWGETSREEALATVHAAVEGGISLIDCAPMYNNAERFIGEAFGGRPPPGVRFTTKHQLGTPERGAAAAALEASVDASLAAMRWAASTSSSCTPTCIATGSPMPLARAPRRSSPPPCRPMPRRSFRRWRR